MEVAGQRVLVVPQLVTGCKIWHLRPEGSFYPKRAWRAAVDALPDGSKVPLLLCHLSCARAMSRCRIRV